MVDPSPATSKQCTPIDAPTNVIAPVLSNFSSDETLKGRALAISKAHDAAAADRLYRQAIKSKTEGQRVVWLYRALDLVGAAARHTGVSPCRSGCNYCCRIPVLITSAEARALARATGRRPHERPVGAVARAAGEPFESLHARLQLQQEALLASHRGEACPFLGADGTCVAYDARPAACRLHISLCDSPDPCDTGAEGDQTKVVVYLNTQREKAFAALILGEHQVIADVRSFFRSDSGACATRSPRKAPQFAHRAFHKRPALRIASYALIGPHNGPSLSP